MYMHISKFLPVSKFLPISEFFTCLSVCTHTCTCKHEFMPISQTLIYYIGFVLVFPACLSVNYFSDNDGDWDLIIYIYSLIYSV